MVTNRILSELPSSSVAVAIGLKTAIVSCSDKTGLADFCRRINGAFQIYSTGGTASFLMESSIAAEPVSELTGFPEILGGRVKTLHPRILGGILSRGKEDLEEMTRHGLTRIELVTVNLYPFSEVVSRKHDLSEAIENIDIGGVTLIRAAAKNYANVIVLTDPSDYGWVADSISQGKDLSEKERLHLASKALTYISDYDITVARYFQSLEQRL